jgi:hypothetical protein
MSEKTVTCSGCNHQSPPFTGSEDEVREETQEWERGHEQVMHDGAEQEYTAQPA